MKAFATFELLIIVVLFNVVLVILGLILSWMDYTAGEAFLFGGVCGLLAGAVSFLVFICHGFLTGAFREKGEREQMDEGQRRKP